jgi:hypothetical protein
MKRTALAVSLVILLGVGVALARPAPGGNPLSRYGLAEPTLLHGQVLERVAAGSYLYLRLRDDSGLEHWVATLRATASSADDVNVTVVARAPSFTSKRLARVFEPLLFGAVSSHPTKESK